MAKTNILVFTTIISLLLTPLAFHHSQTMAFYLEDEDDDYYYVIDFPPHPPSNSNSPRIIKKGTRCDCGPMSHNICNGVWANKRRGLLFCCKKHCRNVLGDKNNCGRCGRKCEQGERCCHGVCTHVFSNEHHCGKCSNKCPPGVPCENGFCGYA